WIFWFLTWGIGYSKPDSILPSSRMSCRRMVVNVIVPFRHTPKSPITAIPPSSAHAGSHPHSHLSSQHALHFSRHQAHSPSRHCFAQFEAFQYHSSRRQKHRYHERESVNAGSAG